MKNFPERLKEILRGIVPKNIVWSGQYKIIDQAHAELIEEFRKIVKETKVDGKPSGHYYEEMLRREILNKLEGK